MSNYVSEATTYSGKVNSLVANVNQLNSEINGIINQLSKLEDSSLKNNVVSSLNNISLKLDELLSSATSNSSKIYTKAMELDIEEREKQKLLSINSGNSQKAGGLTKEEFNVKEKSSGDSNPKIDAGSLTKGEVIVPGTNESSSGTTNEVVITDDITKLKDQAGGMNKGNITFSDSQNTKKDKVTMLYV